eukprot:g1741.t1
MRFHSCKFANWLPATINGISFDSSSQRLAVAREGGSVEIWHIESKWYLHCRIPGSEKVDVKSLQWCAGRLFAAGLHGKIFEVDLVKMCFVNGTDSFGGAVWSFASMPGNNMLAAGCEDGSVRLFEIESDGLHLVSTSIGTTKEGHCGALAWHPSGKVLFAGFADGKIRRIEIATTQTGRVTMNNSFHITLENYGSQDATIVWSLLVLQDMTVISGDSLGHVQMWDGTVGTLLRSFACFEQEGDVLTLAASPDNKSVFASGVDSKIVLFRHISEKSSGSKWVKSASRRVHTHDVYSLAVKQIAKDRTVLVSGGVDTKMCVLDLKNFTNQRSPPQILMPFQKDAVSFGGLRRRLVLVQDAKRAKLQLWQLGNGAKSLENESVSTPTNFTKDSDTLPPSTPIHLLKDHTLLSVIKMSGTNALSCSSVSNNGKWIAAATVRGVKLFRLWGNIDANGRHSVRPRKENSGLQAALRACWASPDSSSSSDFSRRSVDPSIILTMCFSECSQFLYLGDAKGRVHTLALPHTIGAGAGEMEGEEEKEESGKENNSHDEVRHIRSFCVAPRNENQKHKQGEQQVGVRTLAVKPGWIAAGSLGDKIVIFSEKTSRSHYVLPRLGAQHTALAFHPTEDLLAVTCADNKFYMFDVERKCMTDWSKEYSNKLPTSLLDRNDCLLGIVFFPVAETSLVNGEPRKKKAKKENGHQTTSNCLMLYGHSFVCFIDLERPLPSPLSTSTKEKKKRKRKNDNFVMVTRHKPLLRTEFATTSDGLIECIQVQQPWKDVLSTLPEPLYRKRYGT